MKAISIIVAILSVSLITDSKGEEQPMSKVHPPESRAELQEDQDYKVIVLVQADQEKEFQKTGIPLTYPVLTGDLEGAQLSLIDGWAVGVKGDKIKPLINLPEVTAVWIIPDQIFEPYANIIKGIRKWIDSNPDGGPINISLGPPPSLLPMPYHEDEPINLATKAAFKKGSLTIFSAGNSGPVDDTLNPWGLAPWVLEVGAATNDGSALWDGSSRGRKGDPIYRPGVVAPGVDLLTTHPGNVPKTPDLLEAEKRVGFDKMVPPEKRKYYTIVTGSSFAAGGVSGAAAQIYYFFQKAEEAGKKEVRIEFPYKREEHLLDSRRRNRTVGSVDESAENFTVTYPVRHDPALVRQALIDIARPIPGLGEKDAGSGFIDAAIVGELFGTYGKWKTELMSIKVTD